MDFFQGIQTSTRNTSPQFFVELPNLGGKSCVDFMSAPEGIGDSRRIRRLNGESSSRLRCGNITPQGGPQTPVITGVLSFLYVGLSTQLPNL